MADKKNIRTTEEITADIISYFEDNENVFNQAIEELDAYNGFLGDDRYYSMDDLDELLSGKNAIELLNMAFFGYDEGSGNDASSFNPNRDYFKFNAYGNLVSTDYPSYSNYLDKYAVEEMAENRGEIYAINEDETLSGLFDEYEEAKKAEEAA